MIALLHYHFYQYLFARPFTEWGNTVLSGCLMVCITQYFEVMELTEDRTQRN